MAHEPPGMNQLLQALVQVGRIAEAMLAQRDSVAAAQPPPTAAAEFGRASSPEERGEDSNPPAAALESAERATARSSAEPPSSRPSEWRDSMPPPPRQFFTKHASERLHERYGVPWSNIVPTMAALSHQVRGTHFAGIEGVNLGRRPLSDGVNGVIWAVDIFRQVGFVVVDDDGVIVTVLPRDTKQLQQLKGVQRAALDTFRTELQLRHAAPVPLLKYYGRGSR
jgi:hypothetical protein